jgi:hypothetical protein
MKDISFTDIGSFRRNSQKVNSFAQILSFEKQINREMKKKQSIINKRKVSFEKLGRDVGSIAERSESESSVEV